MKEFLKTFRTGLWVTGLAIIAFLVYKFSSCVSVGSARTERVNLSNWRLSDKQELVIASVNATANGRIGEAPVIHSNLFGERHDTLPLSVFTPGARFVDFTNTPMISEIGFDVKLDSGKIFNNGAYGEWNRSRTVFTIYATPRLPGLIKVYADDATMRSDSYFAGRINIENYHTALREKVGNPSYALLVNQTDYADYCYAKAIKIFAEQFYSMSEGSRVTVKVFLNGKDFEKNLPAREINNAGILDVSRVFVR